MPRTLLIGSPGVSWRAWIKQNRADADVLCLDPADVATGYPGIFEVLRGGRTIWERFYGSLDASFAPHILLARAAEGLSLISEDAIILTFAYRPSPVAFQTLRTLVQMTRPERILVPAGFREKLEHLPTSIEVVELGKSLSGAVQSAQRKAHWIRLIERTHLHEISLAQVTIEGVRLGSGYRFSEAERAKVNMPRAYLEACGSTLLAVTEEEHDDRSISMALDLAYASRIHFVRPEEYDRLFCSFARTSGEDIGFGFIEQIDFERLSARVWNTALPGANTQIMRLGGLRVDHQGNELGYVRPWQI